MPLAPAVQPGRIQPGGPSAQPGYAGAVPSGPPPTGTPVLSGVGYKFSGPVVATGLTIGVVVSATRAPVSGTTSYNSSSWVATFIPSPTTPFVVGAKYLVTVSGATAADGTPMLPVSFPFNPGGASGRRWYRGMGRPRAMLRV